MDKNMFLVLTVAAISVCSNVQSFPLPEVTVAQSVLLLFVLYVVTGGYHFLWIIFNTAPRDAM